MTPTRRSSDASKFTLTLRDVLLLLVGFGGIIVATVAIQLRTQASVDRLSTKVDALMEEETATKSDLQRQIDSNRQESQLNRVNIENMREQMSELKGLLVGAGVKGATK